MKTRTKKRPPSLEDLVSKAARSEIASIGTVVSRIFQLLRNPNASAGKLRGIIEVDPPLSAKLLRRANSAFYGAKRNILSIQEAIVFLGFNTVREIAMNLKVGKMFDGSSEEGPYSRRKLWKHSLAVAMCSKAIYRREFKLQGDDIYSSALLHDIGIIVEDQFAHEYFLEVLETMQSDGIDLSSAEISSFGFTHSALAALLIASWKIPEELAVAAAYHHRPFSAPSQFNRASATVFVADIASREAGIGVEGQPSEEDNTNFSRAIESLSIQPESVEIVIEDVAEELDRLEKCGELYL